MSRKTLPSVLLHKSEVTYRDTGVPKNINKNNFRGLANDIHQGLDDYINTRIKNIKYYLTKGLIIFQN